MRVRSHLRRMFGSLPLLAMLVPLNAAAQEPAYHAPMTREQFDALFDRVDNQGRWGERDQKGTLNLITPEVRHVAAAEVREGTTISLGREFVTGPLPQTFEPMQLEFMVLSDTLIGPADGSVSWTAERIRIFFHGGAFTHLDAPAHMSYRGKGYNGPATAGPDGAPLRNTIGEMHGGIFTRGVLVDVPRLRGVPYLSPDAPVTVADLEAWEEHSGIQMRGGDVVLIRTGHWARASEPGPAGGGDGFPGIHPNVALWLHERGVAALGADQNDPAPSLVPGLNAPLHALALVAMGMPLFDNMDLEELAREAAARSRWSFLFVAAPLNIRGATGSPLNPLALF